MVTENISTPCVYTEAVGFPTPNGRGQGWNLGRFWSFGFLFSPIFDKCNKLVDFIKEQGEFHLRLCSGITYFFDYTQCLAHFVAFAM